VYVYSKKSAGRTAFICLNLLKISIKSQRTESAEIRVPKTWDEPAISWNIGLHRSIERDRMYKACYQRHNILTDNMTTISRIFLWRVNYRKKTVKETFLNT
jgi:hypothetical protein